MRERPILFSGPMVRALLAGTKTQTRRVVKPMRGEQSGWLTTEFLSQVPSVKVSSWECGFGVQLFHPEGGPLGWVRCPYGQPGDSLWVRETHWVNRAWDDIRYKATEPEWPYGWTPSIHMFRQASRITLEITAVRVERLQGISEEDAKAEGIELSNPASEVAGEHKDLWKHGKAVTSSPVRAYKHLWESINGTGSWSLNPWVWVVQFKRV